MTHIEEFVRAFFKAIESDEVIGKEHDWYAENAVQVEWPNKLLPAGAIRTVKDLREAGEGGRAIVDRQWYEVTNILVTGNKVAGRSCVPRDVQDGRGRSCKRRGNGGALRDVLRNVQGRIARHHTYDCFDTW